MINFWRSTAMLDRGGVSMLSSGQPTEYKDLNNIVHASVLVYFIYILLL
jgi:hypothetical protein